MSQIWDGGGGGHASIVPKEGSGKATSSRCCGGHHGRERRNCTHTIEKELEGGCQRLAERLKSRMRTARRENESINEPHPLFK